MEIKFQKNGFLYEGKTTFKDGTIHEFVLTRQDMIDELKEKYKSMTISNDDEKLLKDYLAYKEKEHVKMINSVKEITPKGVRGGRRENSGRKLKAGVGSVPVGLKLRKDIRDILFDKLEKGTVTEYIEKAIIEKLSNDGYLIK